MRHSATALALALLAAGSALAAPHYRQDRKSNLFPVGRTVLQRRTAINTGNGNNNDNNGDEDENDLEASEPEELPGLEGQAPETPGELENLQDAQREEQEETSGVRSDDIVEPDVSPLPRGLTEIVERQARLMIILYLEHGIEFEDTVFFGLGNDIRYLSESSARQIMSEVLAPVRSAEDPEAAASQLIEDELDALSVDEVEEQQLAIIRFIFENSDLSSGAAAPNLVQLALNQSRIVAHVYARKSAANADLLTRLLYQQNPYLNEEEAGLIARAELARYLDADEEGGPSLMERLRNWWRNRGGGSGGGGGGSGR